MKAKIVLLIILFLTINVVINAQTNYTRYMTKGDELIKENKYIDALGFYDLAYEFAVTQSQKDKAKEGKNKSKEKIRLQQEELLQALANAKKMQRKMEVAVFDRAVKEEIPAWRGFNNYDDEDALQQQLNKVKKLDFYNASLVRLPEPVKLCKSLKEINLLANYEFSDEEWENCLSSLYDLSNNLVQISVNNADIIDQKYWHKISGLEILSKNQSAFPSGVSKMRNLKYLDISGNFDNQNFFNQLPDDFYQLSNLEKLKLNYCNIDSLSLEIGNLKKLKHLGMIGNNLASLPKSIEKLNDLSYLNVSGNKIDLGEILNIMPYFNNKVIISTRTNRENNDESLLVVSPDNPIRKEIIDLPINIKELDLATARKIQLDSVLSSVVNLKKKIYITTDKSLKVNSEDLLITIPKINTLPPVMVSIENLTYLDLSEIKSLDFTELFNLFKSYNKDIYLSTKQNPDFKDINSIWICLPKLDSIPEEIGSIESLVSLTLSNCDLTSIPKEIGNLERLTNLDLCNNKLGSLPKEIKRLKNLENINLSNNELTEFPEGLLKLKKIKQLDLSNNLIITIPNQINKIENLISLNMANNRLKEVPESINDLKKIQSIDLFGNDVSNTNVISQSVQIKQNQYELATAPSFENPLKLSKGILEKNSMVKFAWSDKHSGKRKQTLAIIIGYTAGPYNATISSLTNERIKASIHFVVDRDGTITQLVNANEIAWHAGRTEYKDLQNFNSISIGIDLVNDGLLTKKGEKYVSWFGSELTKEDVIEATHRNEKNPRYWHVYTQNQIDATYNLCKLLINNFKDVKYILGHEEIAVGRKLDPGPAFPMDQLREKLGLQLK